jgi:hypothetical protein
VIGLADSTRVEMEAKAFGVAAIEEVAAAAEEAEAEEVRVEAEAAGDALHSSHRVGEGMLTWRRLWKGSREKCATRLKTKNKKCSETLPFGSRSMQMYSNLVKSITKFSGLLVSSEKTTKKPLFRCKEDE